MIQKTGYAIRDVSFRDIVEKHQNDPGIRSVAGEVAVMRSILDMLLSQVKLTAELNDLDPGSMNAILQTSKMVTEACEKMVSIEAKLTAKLSIDQLSVIATTMFNAVVEICQPTPDQAHRLAASFAKACNPRVQVMVDAETGEMATFEGELEKIKAHPVQDRITMTGGTTAFTETARVPDGHGRQHPPPRPPMPPSVAQRLTDMARHGRTWDEQP